MTDLIYRDVDGRAWDDGGGTSPVIGSRLGDDAAEPSKPRVPWWRAEVRSFVRLTVWEILQRIRLVPAEQEAPARFRPAVVRGLAGMAATGAAAIAMQIAGLAGCAGDTSTTDPAHLATAVHRTGHTGSSTSGEHAKECVRNQTTVNGGTAIIIPGGNSGPITQAGGTVSGVTNGTTPKSAEPPEANKVLDALAKTGRAVQATQESIQATAAGSGGPRDAETPGGASVPSASNGASKGAGDVAARAKAQQQSTQTNSQKETNQGANGGATAPAQNATTASQSSAASSSSSGGVAPPRSTGELQRIPKLGAGHGGPSTSGGISSGTETRAAP